VVMSKKRQQQKQVDESHTITTTSGEELLLELGYGFRWCTAAGETEEGQGEERLVSLATLEPFHFVSYDHRLNTVGAAVLRFIQDRMKLPAYGALEEVWLPDYRRRAARTELATLLSTITCPTTTSTNEAAAAALQQRLRCNVFISPPEVMATAKRLLVFICGMGPVRCVCAH